MGLIRKIKEFSVFIFVLMGVGLSGTDKMNLSSGCKCMPVKSVSKNSIECYRAMHMVSKDIVDLYDRKK